MAQPADDKQLGEHQASTGKMSREELQACIEAQQQAGSSGSMPPDQVVADRGHPDSDELNTVALRPGAAASHPAGGQETLGLGAEITPHPSAPASSSRTQSAETLSEEVKLALANASQRIGPYVVLSELGRGGMGVVHRCHDTRLHRDVAVKIVRNLGADSEVQLARFKQEARAAAKIRHPGIVAIHEVGEDQGQPYLVMDYVEGQTLEELLESEQLTPHRIAELIREIALTLDHAHSAGITHRDVKPQNIMLDSGGHTLLMDFGLARDSSAQLHLTKTGQVLGTPMYMAPEQIGGSDIGPWTDVYALGAMLYRSLVDQPPFQAAEPASLFKQILMDEPQPLQRIDPTINRDLETITLRCLEKRPDRRYPSAAAVADELKRFLDGQAILARPIGRGEKAVRWVLKNRALAAAMAMSALVVTGAAGVVIHQASEADKAAKEGAIRAVDEANKERQAIAMAKLRTDISAVLDEVRSGDLLKEPNESRQRRAEILSFRNPEAVRLLTSELDEVSRQLGDTKGLTQGQELYLRFLCETLAELGIPDDAVTSLGRYLETEISLPRSKRDQLRAVPAGKALCLLGGEEAERLLSDARERLGDKGPFWRQVQPTYSLTGVDPGIRAMTPDGFLGRGVLLLEKGDIAGAIADYDRAIALNPNFVRAWCARAHARKLNDDLDGAILDLNRAIEIDPNDKNTFYRRGHARKDVGDLHGAVTDFSRAIEIDPNYGMAWNSRGVRRTKLREFDSAIGDFNRALEIKPDWAIVLNNRGNAKNKKGDIAGAIADYSRSIEVKPNRPAAWLNRGNAKEKIDDIDGAITDWERFLQLAPMSSGVASLRNRLDRLRKLQAARGDKAGK